MDRPYDAVMRVKDDVPPELGDPVILGRSDIVLTSESSAEGIWGMRDDIRRLHLIKH